MKKIMIIGIFMLIGFTTIAQDSGQDNATVSKANLGLGMGLDYGGFGMRLSYLPTNTFGLFGSLGYNLNGAGFNFGGFYRFAPDKKICPYLIAMYGYNAVIVVQNATHYNQTYLGPSIGVGFEFHGRNPKRFFNIELLLPFRSKEYKDDLQALKDDPNISFKNEPIPVAFCFGYHFKF